MYYTGYAIILLDVCVVIMKVEQDRSKCSILSWSSRENQFSPSSWLPMH